MAYQYGEEQVGYGVAESSYGVAVVPAATDAFRLTDFNVTPNYARPEVPETRATRSLQERVAGRKSASWAIGLVNRPSGTAGTPPDYHLLLKHTFGTYTNTPATSDAYTLLKDPSALSLSLYRQFEGLQEGVYGAVVQNCTFSWSGDAFATIAFSGVAKDMLWAGTSAANGTGASTTALIVDDGDFFGKYGVVAIAALTAAKQIASVSGDTATLAATASWSNNDAVRAFLPDPTLAGGPLYGTLGSLSFDGGSTTIGHITGTLSVATGIGLHEREFGTSTPAGVTLPQRRSVTGNLSFLVEDDDNYAILRGEANNKTAQNVRIDIGTTAGSICRIAAPKVDLEASPLSGGAGLIEVNISFVALTSAVTASEDEVSVTYL